MDIKYKKNNENMTVLINGDLDEYSANVAKNILDKIIFDNLNTKKFVFDL